MKGLALILTLLLLVGCARFEPRPLTPSQTAAQLEQRSLADPNLRLFIERNQNRRFTEWPSTSWDFEALTLAAFYFHPDLEVARAQWAVAEAGQITAGERPNPTVGVSPGYDTTTSVPSPWIVTATLDIPIETPGKRGHRIAEAEHLSEAARLNVASVAWQVRSRVRSSLLDLQVARELEALLGQQQRIHAENVRLLELQHRLGAISAFELTQARLASDDAKLALHDAEQHVAEARARLAEAVGVPVHALEGVRFSFEDLDRLPSDLVASDARRRALSNRADVLSALAEYAATQSALQQEIAKQYPDIHLGPGYEYDQGDDKWTLGLSVTLPAFNRNQGAIAEAQARRYEAAARFEALQARVLAEIDIALARLRVASRKQTDAEAMLADLTKQEEVAEAMRDAGEISKGELVGLQLQLSASTLARRDAWFKALQAAGQLEDALQSPLDMPVSAWRIVPRVTETKDGISQP